MNKPRCYHCKKAIRSMAKAEFFALVENKRTGVREEAYLHTRCIRPFNEGEEVPDVPNKEATP